TQSMKIAMLETERRRKKQITYNKKMDIIPSTIVKAIPEQVTTLDEIKHLSRHDLIKEAIETEATMKRFAEELDFERAIEYRERLAQIQKELKK
ncbi:MAG TPA: UvrB/UvrC motif-containing protein, partial [Nitrosopumilaceae archaeon]|nr:UvrB/UvrC motif-containing protein [Nitrosopumilaceae archaeon]